jgi:hypothetical protein
MDLAELETADEAGDKAAALSAALEINRFSWWAL